ncbi:hypothetical protein HRbin06_00524 [archaeon HR06]|nr:hypothetical protein HRbin06_00524 [archaeon HR06]
MKEIIRKKVWDLLLKERVATFPPPHNRIPNFLGAKEAAINLTKMKLWEEAKVVKVNPDSPQYYVRELVLRDKKLLIVPTPKLKGSFLILRDIPEEKIKLASTIKGAFIFGKSVKLEDLPNIDLVVLGSVAVNRFGDRIGKRGGYAEIEWALVREEGKVKEDTPVVTTVHDLQIIEDEFPTFPYDLPVDWIFTPKRVIKTERKREKPKGIYWDLMPKEKIREIPLLRERYKV